MIKRLILLGLATVLILLVVAGVAMAATPQQIYDDFAANGPFPAGKYSDADLRAYLNDATIHQYGNSSTISQLDNLANELLTRETFPFTGFQIMIAGIVAVVLVGGGIALRRFSRPQKS
jgi:hypothetical protein